MKQPIYDGTNEDECEYYDNVIMDLPTYEEYYKENFPRLVDAIKFHYDVDIDNFIGDPWEIVGEIAEDCPNWLNHFHKEFEENLREREYIK
jgi:hypothetical protein